MFDFLIIGQGLAGSILAYKLLKAGKKVLIIDDSEPLLLNKAAQKIIDSKHGHLVLKYSDYFYPKLKKILGKDFKPRVIGGLITPVTGKRFTKTWLADTLLPYAAAFYRQLQDDLNISFYKPTPIVRIFADTKQANDWDVRRADDDYDKLVYKNYIFKNDQIYYPYGYTVFKDGAVVDGAQMLSAFQQYFKKTNSIVNRCFSAEAVKLNKDYFEWQDITARQIIFCEGWQAINNPYFKWLPFMPAKGELLVIQSENLNLMEVINRGIFIRPLGHHLYLTGSTYTWDDLTLQTTKQARDEISHKLKTVIKTNFKIVEQLAGIRPTVKGRRPFIGQHPQHENMYICNGFGTKGLLLAPYFTEHLCDHLIRKKPLRAEADIKRFC